MPRFWLLRRWARKAGRHTLDAPAEATLRQHLAAEAERIILAVDQLTETCWFCLEPADRPCRTVHGRAPGTIRAEPHKGRGQA